jgi:hypothetical protein
MSTKELRVWTMTSLSGPTDLLFEHNAKATVAELNPYGAPTAAEVSKFIGLHVLTKSDLLRVGIISYGGTLLAACLMGFGLMGFAGAILAPLIAIFSATPVTLVTFLTVWALSPWELRKWKVVSTAAFSGGASGVLVFGWTAFFNAEMVAFSAVAGSLGAVGASAAVALYLRSFENPNEALVVSTSTWADLDGQTPVTERW